MIYKNYIQFDQDYGGGGGGSSTSINQFTGPAVTINDTNQSSNAEIPTSLEVDWSTCFDVQSIEDDWTNDSGYSDVFH